MLITNYVNSFKFSLHISHIPPVFPFSHHYLKSRTHYLFHGFFYALPDSHPPSVFLLVNYFIQYDQINFPAEHLINIMTVSLFKSFCCHFLLLSSWILINPHNHLLFQFCNLAQQRQETCPMSKPNGTDGPQTEVCFLRPGLALEQTIPNLSYSLASLAPTLTPPSFS